MRVTEAWSSANVMFGHVCTPERVHSARNGSDCRIATVHIVRQTTRLREYVGICHSVSISALVEPSEVQSCINFYFAAKMLRLNLKPAWQSWLMRNASFVRIAIRNARELNNKIKAVVQLGPWPCLLINQLPQNKVVARLILRSCARTFMCSWCAWSSAACRTMPSATSTLHDQLPGRCFIRPPGQGHTANPLPFPLGRRPAMKLCHSLHIGPEGVGVNT